MTTFRARGTNEAKPSTYGWSFLAEVYHEAPVGAYGWSTVPCCGERWLDATSGARPQDRRPCDHQARINLLPAYRTCTVPGCGGIRQAHGMCKMHQMHQERERERLS